MESKNLRVSFYSSIQMPAEAEISELLLYTSKKSKVTSLSILLKFGLD